MSMYLYLNSHTFVLLAFERFLLFLRPSKHSEIFINSVVLIMMLALWIFDGVMSAFPYFGWGTVSYFSSQFQCAMDHEKNIRETNFVTVMCFGIPISLCLGLYLFIFIMIRKIKRREDDNGALIVERNNRAIGDSYSQRLKNQQLKFQNAGTKAVKPNIGKNSPTQKMVTSVTTLLMTKTQKVMSRRELQSKLSDRRKCITWQKMTPCS